MEIPVSNAKPGTVAVLVHPDGTEEILKDSTYRERHPANRERRRDGAKRSLIILKDFIG